MHGTGWPSMLRRFISAPRPGYGATGGFNSVSCVSPRPRGLVFRFQFHTIDVAVNSAYLVLLYL